MKKVLLAGLAMSALALGAPSAHATDYDIIGGCSFASISDAVAGQGQQTGEIDVQAIVYSPTASENLVSAKITCYITVNGAAQPGATLTVEGTVVVAGATVATYTSGSVANNVQLCQTVEYSGPGGSSTVSSCAEATTIEIPPQIVWDTVDPIVCAVLAPLSPGVAGVADINSQGDVWIAGEPFFDCPPYDMDWGV